MFLLIFNNMYYVYIHRKADTKEVFYVGKGNGNRAYTKVNRSNLWKNVVKKHGYIVEFVEVGLQEWAAFELEVERIAYYGRRDLNQGSLVNFTDGGEGSSGHIWTEEMKSWRSAETIKQMQDPKMREDIALSKRGKKLSQEHAEFSRKHLLAQKNKVKEVNSKLMKERWQTSEFREKMLSLSINKVMSEEVKKKIGAANSRQIKRSDGVVYASANEAARALSKSHSKISMVACGKRKTAYGYGWEYV